MKDNRFDHKRLMREALDHASMSLDEEAVTDDLGDIVAHDWITDAAVHLGDAVQDVLQDHARELIAGFVERSNDEGPMLARRKDVDGLANDIVRTVLSNEDFRTTLVVLAKNGLRKLVR